MTTCPSRARVAIWSLVAVACLARGMSAQLPIGRDEFSPWIAAHHPNVISGDRRVNAVLIVVDTNNQYVASVADSLPLAVTAAIDAVFASVASRNEFEGMARDLVAGRLQVPGADGTQPIYIVDGVRVGRVDSLNANEIENIKVLSGTTAASKYGPDAGKGGAIVVTISHPEVHDQVIASSNRERVTKAGIASERVDLGDTQMMHLKAGVVGPYPMYITVVRLKKT